MKPVTVIAGAGLTIVALSFAGSPVLGFITSHFGQDSHEVSVQRDSCSDRYGGDGERACEVREVTVDAPRGALMVDGGTNGGIKVFGESRRDVRLVAEVWATARTMDRAEELLDEISIETSDADIQADGPETSRRESWGVSWRVSVPHQTDLDLSAHNGGIAISDVDGEVRFQALNGGVTLTGMAGDVRGKTVNGGLKITLEGDRWDGAGLDATTTNGGVQLEMAENYSADLETGTVNGRIDTEIAMQVSGQIGRTLKTQLGDGGAPIRVATTNGGVRIRAN